jgi:hypothetical protein
MTFEEAEKPLSSPAPRHRLRRHNSCVTSLPERGETTMETILIIVVLLFLFGGGGYYWNSRRG